MAQKTPILALALAAPLLFAGAAMAQTAAPAAPAAPAAAAPAAPAAPATSAAKAADKFDAANTTHDGKLTKEQAEAAGNLKGIVKHWDEIDTDKKGYVTKQDVKAFHQKMKAKKEAKAAAPAAPAAPQ